MFRIVRYKQASPEAEDYYKIMLDFPPKSIVPAVTVLHDLTKEHLKLLRDTIDRELV